MAAHLVNISKLLASNEIDENDMENSGETLFVINGNNKNTLGFVEIKRCKMEMLYVMGKD